VARRLREGEVPDNYIALESVTGPTEVWYLSPYASQAAYGESMARQNADAALTVETERLARGDAEFVSEMNAIQAVARPELSHGKFPDLAMMRFWEIETFRVKPGHDEEFAAAVKAYAAAAGDPPERLLAHLPGRGGRSGRDVPLHLVGRVLRRLRQGG